MNDSTTSMRLVELYYAIGNREISIGEIHDLLDADFGRQVLQVKKNTDILLPLVAACRQENIDILKLLIRHPIYSELTEQEGFRLLEKCSDSDNFIGFDYLVNHLQLVSTIDINTTFERCCTLGCKNMVKYLLHPERPWKIDVNSTTGLENACSQENKELVIYLLNNGADISNKNYVAVTISFTNSSLDILNYFLFELDIDLLHMKECVSKVKIEPQEKILLERFLQVVDNAILTNNLNKKLTSKTTKVSHKI